MMKIIIALGLFLVIIIAVTLWQGDKYKKFMETADKASGTILRKEERIADPNTRRKEYWVTYRFEFKGRNYTTQELVEYEDLWKSLRENYPADVYYNRNKPSDSHLALLMERRLGIVNKISAQR